MSLEGITAEIPWIQFGLLKVSLDPESGALNHLIWNEDPILQHSSLQPFVLEWGKDKLNTTFSLRGRNGLEGSDLSRLRLEYETTALPGLKLIQQIEPGFRPHSLLQTFSLETSANFLPGVDPSVHAFKATLSGIGAASWLEARVSVPMARFLPDQPLQVVAERPRNFPPGGIPGEYEDLGVAPDCGLGAVLLSCGENRHLAVIPLGHESPVRTFVFGHDDKLAVENRFGIELLLGPCQSHLLGRQMILAVEGTRHRFHREISLAYAHFYPQPSGKPNWAKNATVLEADFVHYGGIAGLTQKLPVLQRQGFDTIYLMPWHTGPFSGYGTLDYWQIDPQKGNFEELKTLTAKAHESGLKVLFDLLVNMATAESPYLENNPDWFYRDAAGCPQRHTVWPGFALDPASPGYRSFLRDYCRRCVRDLGADGFRVDAVAYRGGNWNPLTGFQPHQHAHAIFSLLEEIRRDIQAIKPEAILMSECFGPAQVPCSDLVCYQWVGWLDWILERLNNGSVSGREIGALLRDHFGIMPTSTWLTTYTHTHDTVAFQGREWDGAAVRTYFTAVTLLSAASMTFGGGWDMRERPSEAEKEPFRELAAFRKTLGGVTSDEVLFLESPIPQLLVAERNSTVGRLRLTANFSAEDLSLPSTGKHLYSMKKSPAEKIKAWDVVVENIS